MASVPIKIQVADKTFYTTETTLNKSPMLQKLLEWHKNSNSTTVLFLDKDADLFRIIIGYLRDNVILPNNYDADLLVSLFDYYGIVDDDAIIKICKIKELDHQIGNAMKDRNNSISCEFKFTYSMINVVSSDVLKNFGI